MNTFTLLKPQISNADRPDTRYFFIAHISIIITKYPILNNRLQKIQLIL